MLCQIWSFRRYVACRLTVQYKLQEHPGAEYLYQIDTDRLNTNKPTNPNKLVLNPHRTSACEGAFEQIH